MLDLLHKSHYASIPYPTIHNFVTEMWRHVHIFVKNSASWDKSDVLWDLRYTSILYITRNIHRIPALFCFADSWRRCILPNRIASVALEQLYELQFQSFILSTPHELCTRLAVFCFVLFCFCFVVISCR